MSSSVGNSGTPGRVLHPSSYHQSHLSKRSNATGAGGGKKRLHSAPYTPPSSARPFTNGESKAASDYPSSLKRKKSKVASDSKTGSDGEKEGAAGETMAAAAAAASSNFSPATPSTPSGKTASGNTSFKRGIYLAFVDNALQEKRKGRIDPYNELVAQFKAQSSSALSAPSSSNTSTNSIANKPTNVKSFVEALTHVVAQLDRSHNVLVDSVLSLPWTSMDEAFVNSHMRFVRALLTTRSEFVQMALEKIVKGFRFQQTAIYAAESASPDAITRRQTYERLHTLLSSLIYLIPTLPATLWPVLNKHFPHKRESRNSQVVYISNALRVVEYCPQLGEHVLTAVIVRALQIDVEIQVDIEDLEDDEGVLDEEVFGFSLENPFDRVIGDDDDSDSDSDDDEGPMNPDDISSDEDISSSSDDDDDEDNDETSARKKTGQADEGVSKDADGQKILSPKVIKRLKEMAAKLDAILRVVFDFLQRLRSSSSSALHPRPGMMKSASLRTLPGTPIPFELDTPRAGSDEGEAAAADYLSSHNHALLQNVIYKVLLTAFEEKILRTFQTKHTQFILFWYASLSPEFADEFMGTLLARVVNDNEETPTVTRVAAAAYVASFVSRSASIDAQVARQVMALLCQCLDSELELVRYMTMLHSQTGQAHTALSGPEADKLVKSSVVVYAVAQAVFYIFCFRWRDFLDESEDELDFLEGVPAKRRWMLELESIKMAVNSPLNPLKMCAPAVVSQFARMAHKTDFMYCHSIIESNKRQSRSRQMTASYTSDTSVVTPTVENGYGLPPPPPSRTPSQSAQALTDHSLVQQTLKDSQLDSHFPFDPYKLPLSAEFVQGIYRNWDGGGFEDDESSDDEDEEEEEEVVDNDTSTEAGTDARTDGGDSSMQPSSIDSEAIMQNLKSTKPVGAVDIRGMIDPALLSDEEDVAFSQSFDAMSVSPRYNRSRIMS